MNVPVLVFVISSWGWGFTRSFPLICRSLGIMLQWLEEENIGGVTASHLYFNNDLFLSLFIYFKWNKCKFPVGVADGVGGWRQYGIDPGEFSSNLMKTCERLVTCGKFIESQPSSLLARSYNELLENKQPVLGNLILFLEFRNFNRCVKPRLFSNN